MSRDKPWLKMWTEWLGDAKMDRLSLAEQGAWWRLVSLTHECKHIDAQTGKPNGALVVAGSPLSVVEMMKSLKIADEADKAVFNQMLEKMGNAGSLNWDSNTLFMTHYEEEQRALTDTKEARRQRQRESREALKAEKEPQVFPLPEAVRENLLKDIVIWGPPITRDTKPRQSNHTFVLLSLQPMAPLRFDFNESNLTTLVTDVIRETHFADFPPFPGHNIVETRFGNVLGSTFTNWESLFSHISNIPKMVQKCIILESTKDTTPPQDIIEERGKRREAETHAQTSNGKSVTLTELSRCYEKYIGLLNPLDADRMREFTEYYESHEGEIDWIEKAFSNAPINKRRWPYLQAILERYIEEGGPDNGKHKRPARQRRHPITYIPGSEELPGGED